MPVTTQHFISNFKAPSASHIYSRVMSVTAEALVQSQGQLV